MYVRTVRGKVLDFGHRGWLLDESFLFYDRQTDSLWTQATGDCIIGAYKGERLESLPVTHTTWGVWKTQHPETLALAKPLHLIAKYRKDGYAEYYARRGVTFGLAVFQQGAQKLYPLEALAVEPVVHDAVGGKPIVVVFHSPSGTALAFDPTVAGVERRLALAEYTEHELWLRDVETGQLWSGLTGRPRGSQPGALRQLRATQFTVANWDKHFPGSPVYRAAQSRPNRL